MCRVVDEVVVAALAGKRQHHWRPSLRRTAPRRAHRSPRKWNFAAQDKDLQLFPSHHLPDPINSICKHHGSSYVSGAGRGRRPSAYTMLDATPPCCAARVLQSQAHTTYRVRLSYNDIHKAIQASAPKIIKDFGRSSWSVVGKWWWQLTPPQPPTSSSPSAAEASSPRVSSARSARRPRTARSATFPSRLSA